MNNHKHHNCGCNPNPCYNEPVTQVDLQRLWDKIKANFADRDDVLEIIKAVQRLESVTTTGAVQSGFRGPITPVSNDGIVHLTYDDWVEVEQLDDNQQRTRVYNTSTNALSTAAAAKIVKELRKDIANSAVGLDSDNPLITVVTETNENGWPMIDRVNYNTIYLTPSSDDKVDNRWEEWIAVPRRPGTSASYPYTWEHLGSKPEDLVWMRNDIETLNQELAKLKTKVDKYSKKLADAIIDKAVKPLNDFKDYINSPEFITYIYQNFPIADINKAGLMSPNHVGLLTMLSLWASNDHKILGGGAIGADTVIYLLNKQGIPVDSLTHQFNINLGI